MNLAQLEADEKAAGMRAEAEEWMRREGVIAPATLAATLVPTF